MPDALRFQIVVDGQDAIPAAMAEASAQANRKSRPHEPSPSRRILRAVSVGFSPPIRPARRARPAPPFGWSLERSPVRCVSRSPTLRVGRPLSITIGGSYTDWSTAPLLDPTRPSHPDEPDKPDTHEWGSYVVFPRAGCYRLDAQWPQGSWSLVFSFGR